MGGGVLYVLNVLNPKSFKLNKTHLNTSSSSTSEVGTACCQVCLLLFQRVSSSEALPSRRSSMLTFRSISLAMPMKTVFRGLFWKKDTTKWRTKENNNSSFSLKQGMLLRFCCSCLITWCILPYAFFAQVVRSVILLMQSRRSRNYFHCPAFFNAPHFAMPLGYFGTEYSISRLCLGCTIIVED